jgi:hypothetical protein
VLIGEEGRVVLTDFGLATFVDDGSVTGPGLIVGSPQYVSPERARDGASTVESDLWSLGATLYAAVEGRSPYARESAMATLMALATEAPDPPELAGLLAPVLTGLLRHDPEARLTAAEVDRRLRMIVATADGEPAVVDRERALTVPAPRRTRRDRGHAEVAAMSGAPATPAARSVLVRAVPAQRNSSGPVSPAPAGADADPPAAEPSKSRFTLVAAALTAVAILGAGGIVAGYLIQRNDDHPSPLVFPGVASRSSASVAPAAVGGFSPAACNGPVPSDASETPQKNASRGVNGWVLYSGWSYFTDGTGFHMPVPDGWSYQKVGTSYCFRDSDGGRLMTLDTGRKPSADPMQACRKEATRLVSAGALPAYHLIQLEPRPLLNKAADWEYQYTAPDKTLLHVQTRWFATNGKAYAISWQTRDVDWSGDFAKISMVLSTFYADGK